MKKKQKKKRASSQRGGPKFNKPWKMSGARTEAQEDERFSDHRRRSIADGELKSLSGEKMASDEA